MKLFKKMLLIVGVVLAVSAAVKAQSWGRDDRDKDQEQKVMLRGSISIPGPNPIASTDIVWADQTTGSVVFTDRSNASVDVIDGRSDLFVGRVTTNLQSTTASTTVGSTMPGTVHFQGGAGNRGPNGVVTTPVNKAWAADGDSSVKVLDLDPNNLSIIATISTAGFGPLSACTSVTCNRADELAYDPEQNIVAVANDKPAAPLYPFLTFISGDAPYPILGQLTFQAEGAVAGGGLEQPVWDPWLHAFLQTVPQTDASGTGSIVVFRVNPKPFSVTIVNTISLKGFNCSPTGEALGSNEQLLVACGIPGAAAGTRSSFPLVIDVSTGEALGSLIDEVVGGDEVNYNPGENEFVVAANLDGVSSGAGTNPSNPIVLGVINAESGDWIQNAPPSTPASGATMGTGGLVTSGRAGNLAALGSNKHVFVVVHPATAPVTDICGVFGATDFGCVAVFSPIDNDQDRDSGDHHDNDGQDNDHHDRRDSDHHDNEGR
jgi:hypothetical protein